jgi:Winged helix-turn helix/ParB-like nuclease domain
VNLAEKIVMRPIDALIPYASNARQHSDAQIDQIAASIREFGFTNPVLVDGKQGIMAGHGRILAARKLVSMSKREFSRLDVLLRVRSGCLRVTDACVLIGLQRRQVFRLLRGLKQDGATSLLSKHRGKPSNHRLPAEVRTLALSIVRERYADFGPTLAAEKLAEHHGCSVSRETLRGWMIADGL